MQKEDLKIVFMGNPDFAVESMQAIIDAGYNICGVVTGADKVAGRGHHLRESAVKLCALRNDIPILQPTNLKDPEFLESLRKWDADLFVVIAFRMLPREVWQMPRLGTFNLHASLLPKYRGAAPINHAVMNGDQVTGVTTFFLQHEIDTGDIIMQRESPIHPEDNVGDVHDRLMHLGAEMVVETLNDIVASKVKTEPQPEGEFTPAPKIFKETCRIDWNLDATTIHNKVRGLSPYPAAWSTVTDSEGKTIDVKIFTTNIADTSKQNATPGSISIEGGRMFVNCGTGIIEILELQPAGKKRMPTGAYLLGYKPVSFS